METEAHRVRDFLIRTAQPYRWLASGTKQAEDVLAEHRVDEDDLALVVDGELVLPDGRSRGRV